MADRTATAAGKVGLRPARAQRTSSDNGGKAVNEILHTIIDVLAGRRNLPASEADQLHETLTPGYTIPAPSAADVAAAQAVLDRQAATAAAPAPAQPEAPAADGSGS